MINIPDFDEYQFHDSKIHGFSFIYNEWERGLVFDIDYILDGPKSVGSSYEFKIGTGKLYFDRILSVNFNTNETEFYVYKIEREPIIKNNTVTHDTEVIYYNWKIILVDEKSYISVVASEMKFVRNEKVHLISGGRLSLYTDERD